VTYMGLIYASLITRKCAQFPILACAKAVFLNLNDKFITYILMYG